MFYGVLKLTRRLLIIFLVSLCVQSSFAQDKGRCYICHSKETGVKKELFVDPGEFEASAHGSRDCADCHYDVTALPHAGDLQPVRCGRCHFEGNVTGAPQKNLEKMFKESVHYAFLDKEGGGEPSCKICHGTHDIRKRGVSPTWHMDMAGVCAKCHNKEYKEYIGSTHGKSLNEKGNFDSPSCTGCHGEHSIKSKIDPSSPTYFANLAEVCGKCHGSLALSEKYGFSTTPVKTFSTSFHGVAIKFGSKTVANCASCHGSHDILPPDDPASSVNPGNLPKTCGKAGCHTGAGSNWAVGRIHVDAHSKDSGIIYYTALFFKWLTISALAGLFLHMSLDITRQAIEYSRRRRERRGEKEPAEQGRMFLRFNWHFRFQHFIMLVSVILLIITGIPIKFHTANLSESVVMMFGGIDFSTLVHRIAASGLIFVGIYHICYTLFSKEGRRDFFLLIPSPKDFTDLMKQIRYFLGLSSEKAKFGRFSYIEKFDYWAVYWGCVIMIGSGLVLWFHEKVMRIFPKYAIDIAKEAHSDEALLATLAIVFWHFYNVHFNPKKFPGSMMFWHGKISEHEIIEEHPLEFEEMKRRNE